MQDRKRIDFELMRILAAFFVIFNHTQLRGVLLYTLEDPRSIFFWLYQSVSIFCTMSVPLFLMISGALLLNRETRSLKKLWIHKVLHFCLILLIWSFFYYLVGVYRANEEFHLPQFLTTLYSSNWNKWNYSYWFLNLYIAVLICLPMLQKFAQSLSNKEFLYLLAIYAVFNILFPCAELLLYRGNYIMSATFYPTWVFVDGVIFPFLGYFLEHRAKNFWNRRRMLLLWLLNLCAILFTCYLDYFREKLIGYYDGFDHKRFVLLNAATIFVTIQQLGCRTDILEKWRKPILSVGGCTFGIYLIHLYLLESPAFSGCLGGFLDRYLSSVKLLSGFLFCGAIFLTGYLITMLLSKIPILKRLVT